MHYNEERASRDGDNQPLSALLAVTCTSAPATGASVHRYQICMEDRRDSTRRDATRVSMHPDEPWRHAAAATVTDSFSRFSHRRFSLPAREPVANNNISLDTTVQMLAIISQWTKRMRLMLSALMLARSDDRTRPTIKYEYRRTCEKFVHGIWIGLTRTRRFTDERAYHATKWISRLALTPETGASCQKHATYT